MLRPLIDDICVNKELISVVKYMTQQKIERFAVAACNSGTAHLDRAYCAEKFPQKKPYAFGFMVLAYMSEMMEINFGEQWLTTGDIDIKFVGAIYAGQSYVISGAIDAIEESGSERTVRCTIKASIDNGGCAAVGTASVKLAQTPDK